MIRLSFLLLLLMLLMTLPAQLINKEQYTFTETDYWKKYRLQKVVAGSLLGGGLLLIVVSSKIRNNSIRNGTYYSNQFWPNTMMLAGGQSVTVSIPVFFAAARNKGKALGKQSK